MLKSQVFDIQKNTKKISKNTFISIKIFCIIIYAFKMKFLQPKDITKVLKNRPKGVYPKKNPKLMNFLKMMIGFRRYKNVFFFFFYERINWILLFFLGTDSVCVPLLLTNS
jgi:hypothetical protein